MGHRHASTPTCLPHPMPLLHPLYEHQRDSLARWIVLSAQPPLFWSRHVVRCTMLWSCCCRLWSCWLHPDGWPTLTGKAAILSTQSLSCAFQLQKLDRLGLPRSSPLPRISCCIFAPYVRNGIGLSRPSAPPASSTAKQPCPMLCAGPRQIRPA